MKRNAIDPRHASTVEMAQLTGVTFRQLDYWSRRGLVEPAKHADGSGTRRAFHRSQVGPIRLIGAVQSALGGQIPMEILADIMDLYDDGQIMLRDDISLALIWEAPA